MTADDEQRSLDDWIEARQQALLDAGVGRCDGDSSTDGGNATDEISLADGGSATDVPDFARGAEACLQLLDEMRRMRQAGSSGSPSAEHRASELPPTTVALPERVGRFRIERELGRGGQGVVLLAVDEQLGRRVALKLPHPGALAADDLRRRFVREAEAAAGLSHPNIVAVHEVVVDGPLVGLATEYCAGGTLAEWLAARTAPLSPRQAASLFVPLAEALEHAHQHGIFHRDLKPANVLLAGGPTHESLPRRQLPLLKLADFGLAKVLADEGTLTGTNAVLGTANYMAPEQADSRIAEIGAAADIFSLGVLLYEALVGRPPFVGAGRTDTMRRLLTEEPIPPRRLRRDVPADLEAICLKCLEKQPRRRYASADELAQDLRRFVRGEPTHARPLNVVQRTVRWARRRPTAAALVGVSSLSALALAVVVAVYNQNLRTALDSALAAKNAELEARQESDDRARLMRQRVYADDVSQLFEGWQTERVSGLRDALLGYLPSPGQEDLRTFLWHFLYRRTFGDQRVLHRHEGWVYRAGYSPDGGLIASCGADGLVKLWDCRQQRVVRVLTGHGDEVNGLAFSPADNYLATASNDGTVRIWSLRDKSPPRVLEGMAQNWVYTVAYSPDGKLLAAGGKDNVVWIWETDGFQEMRRWEEPGSIEQLAFSRDGRWLDIACGSGELRRADVESSEAGSQPLHKAESKINAFVQFHDGKSIAWVDRDSKHIQIANLESGKVWRRIPYRDAHSILYLGISPDDRWLAVAWRDGVIQLVDLHRQQSDVLLHGHAGTAWCAKFAADGERLLTAGEDGTVREWDLASALVRSRRVKFSTGDELRHSEVSPDGQWLAAEFASGKFTLWQTRDFRTQWVKQSIGVIGSERSLLLFSPDGRQLFVACNTHSEPYGRCELRSITVETGDERIFGRWESHIRGLAVSPDNQWIAVAIHDGRIHVLDAHSGVSLQVIEASPNSLADVKFTQDGRYLVTTSTGPLQVWNTSAWQKEEELAVPGVGSQLIALSPDGRWLATLSGNGGVLWDLPTRTPRLLVGNTYHVERLTFSPDSLTLAALSADTRVRLWDVRTARLLATIEDPGRMMDVRFLPNGDLALTISAHMPNGERLDGIFEVHSIAPPRWTEEPIENPQAASRQ